MPIIRSKRDNLWAQVRSIKASFNFVWRTSTQTETPSESPTPPSMRLPSTHNPFGIWRACSKSLNPKGLCVHLPYSIRTFPHRIGFTRATTLGIVEHLSDPILLHGRRSRCSQSTCVIVPRNRHRRASYGSSRSTLPTDNRQRGPPSSIVGGEGLPENFSNLWVVELG